MRARGSELHPERNAQIVQLRLEGASLQASQAHLRLTRSAVSRTLCRAGVVECKADAATRARAVALVAEVGTVEAARRVRFSRHSVRRWVRQAKEASRVS